MPISISTPNEASKHMLGAEVDFYIQGMEYQPEKIVHLLKKYYLEQPKYRGLKDFEEFQRFDACGRWPWISSRPESR